LADAPDVFAEALLSVHGEWMTGFMGKSYSLSAYLGAADVETWGLEKLRHYGCVLIRFSGT